MTAWIVVFGLIGYGLFFLYLMKYKKKRKEVDEYKKLEHTVDRLFLVNGRMRDMLNKDLAHSKEDLKQIRHNIKKREQALENVPRRREMTFEQAIEMIDNIGTT